MLLLCVRNSYISLCTISHPHLHLIKIVSECSLKTLVSPRDQRSFLRIRYYEIGYWTKRNFKVMIFNDIIVDIAVKDLKI